MTEAAEQLAALPEPVQAALWDMSRVVIGSSREERAHGPKATTTKVMTCVRVQAMLSRSWSSGVGVVVNAHTC
jgi:hypothetical protein